MIIIAKDDSRTDQSFPERAADESLEERSACADKKATRSSARPNPLGRILPRSSSVSRSWASTSLAPPMGAKSAWPTSSFTAAPRWSSRAAVAACGAAGPDRVGGLVSAKQVGGVVRSRPGGTEHSRTRKRVGWAIGRLTFCVFHPHREVITTRIRPGRLEAARRRPSNCM